MCFSLGFVSLESLYGLEKNQRGCALIKIQLSNVLPYLADFLFDGYGLRVDW